MLLTNADATRKRQRIAHGATLVAVAFVAANVTGCAGRTTSTAPTGASTPNVSERPAAAAPTARQVALVTVSSSARGIAAAPDGTVVIAGGNNNVRYFNATNNTLEDASSPGDCRGIYDVNAGESTFDAACGDNAMVYTYNFDGTPGGSFPVGKNPLAVAPVKGGIWVADDSGGTVYLIDDSGGAVKAMAPLEFAAELAGTADGGVWAAGFPPPGSGAPTSSLHLLSATGTETKTVPLTETALALAVSSNVLYVAQEHHVEVLGADGTTPARSVAAPSGRPLASTVAAVAGGAYFADTRGAVFFVTSTATISRVTQLPTTYPHAIKLIVSADGTSLYVLARAADNHCALIRYALA